MKQGKLVVFQDWPMVIVYGGEGDSWMGANPGSQIPGFLQMTEEDQDQIYKALCSGDVVMYFFKEESKSFPDIKFSHKVSPFYGRIAVLDENGALPDTPFTFTRPVLDGPVITFPIKKLPFLVEAFSSIKAMNDPVSPFPGRPIRSLTS